MLKTLERKARRLIELWLESCDAVVASRASRVVMSFWFFRLLFVDKFSINELRAYAPHLKHIRDQLPVLISKESSLAPLAKLNPPEVATLTEDKHLFYKHCHKLGLPIPRHLFTSGSDDERLTAWLSMSEDDAFGALPEKFILKDRAGAYGSGFAAFEKKSNRTLRSADGVTHTLGELRHLLCEEPRNQLVVQERVFDHVRLRELSGTCSLQCLRLVSFREPKGEIRYPFSILKLIGAGNITDNFSGGSSGNLIATVDMSTGRLVTAVAGHPSGLGLVKLRSHPDSGLLIEDFTIPHWSESLNLTEAAHRSIPGLTAIGWDIALTDEGPLLLEANAYFDPPMYAPQLLSAGDWRALFAVTYIHKPPSASFHRGSAGGTR